MVGLAELGVVCAIDDRGRPVRALPDDDQTLETIEAFADFLRAAGPPARKGERKAFTFDYWEALDRFGMDQFAAMVLDHHADRWTAQASIGWGLDVDGDA